MQAAIPLTSRIVNYWQTARVIRGFFGLSLQTPILFCVFNRPDLTRQVFDRIAQQRPQRLLLACDGPRQESPTDQRLVNEVREIVTAVDWPCQVQTYFADQNRGCRQQMANAISWGFEQAERLIILEDDCLPDPSFFGYCESLLERYAGDPQVMMISGDNFQPAATTPNSYYFSAYSHIWGWASWRRAWQHYDLAMSDWPEHRANGDAAEILGPFCTDENETAYWRGVFDRQHAGQIDTWDYSWAYSCWANGGLTILPESNLVSNIGFRKRCNSYFRCRECARWKSDDTDCRSDSSE